MGNANQKSSSNEGEKYKIAVIGDTQSGKTMLLLGLIMTSKTGFLTRRLTVFSEDHKKEIDEMRTCLQKGTLPGGTTNLSIYNLYLQRTRLWGRKAITYPIACPDYRGGDIKDGVSFFDQKFEDCDGVLFLMNPGQTVLNLGKEEDANDSQLSILTNLINGISGDASDHKIRAIAMAAAVTAMDRLRKGGDLHKHSSTFFEIFNRYIVNPLKNNANGIACKTDFKISVTGHVESQDKIKSIDPRNNAAEPFLWLIDRIERQKHPIRYWAKRLWPVFLLVSLAVIGCFMRQVELSDIVETNEKGEYAFKMAREKFGDDAKNAKHREYVQSLSNCVNRLETKWIIFSEARRSSDVAYTNLLTKYLLVEADAAFLKTKKHINEELCNRESNQAWALLISSPDCNIETPEVFNHYKALGYTNAVASATNRLDELRRTKLPEVVSEYNEKYFDARFDILKTNACQMASHEYIDRLQNELDVWKKDCTSIETSSNIIEDVSRRFDSSETAWRSQYATNAVKQIRDFKLREQDNPKGIFEFGRNKIGSELHELLKKEEPLASAELEAAKNELLDECRNRYFGQKQFQKDSEQYPQDGKLLDNLTILLQDTSLTNCISQWMSDLHAKQREWLFEELGRVQDSVQKALDYDKFLMRPPEGTGKKVHEFLECCKNWADKDEREDKKNMFYPYCTNIWSQFRGRYFADEKWTFGDNFEYPKTEDNLESKIKSFLQNTPIEKDIENEIGEWFSIMRKKQMRWLTDAMTDVMKFHDGFDAFNREEGSGEDIKDVLIAAKSFVDEFLSEPEDHERVNEVNQKRNDFYSSLKSKYFEADRFNRSHQFSLEEGKRWRDVYRFAEDEMVKGLERIFVPETETGYNINDVTNGWTRVLFSHERAWLIESKNKCIKEANQAADCNDIVQFITGNSGNPFLWQYVRDVKKKSVDFGLSEFYKYLSQYAENHDQGTLDWLKGRSVQLFGIASALAKNANLNNRRYAGLYDIFALRHLWTNSVSVSMSKKCGDLKEFLGKGKEVAEAISGDNWLTSEYKINSIRVNLTHPEGVVSYRPRTKGKWQLNQDHFFFSVDTGEVGEQGNKYFLQERKPFECGKGQQTFRYVWGDVVINKDIQLSMFSDMNFAGIFWEEYTRDNEEKGKSDSNPLSVGNAKKPRQWRVVARVPHLRKHLQDKDGCFVQSNKYEFESSANKRVGDTNQKAYFTVSVYGEVVGPTPYERIDACMRKSQEVESDNSNLWLKRYSDAEQRLNELNRILSDGNELNAGGQLQ